MHLRTVLSMTISAAILLSSVAVALSGENDSPRSVIDRALLATGGAEQLAQHRAGTWEGRGFYHGFGGVQFTIEGARQGEDQIALKTVSTSAGGTFTRVLVVNRDRGWLMMNGQRQELDKEALAEEKERLYGNWVATLLPLPDAKYRLKRIGESKVGDRAVVGLEVASDGHRPVRLYFDRDSGLLAKKETQATARQQPGKEVTEDVIFSDYQSVDGVKHATKVKLLVDGKLTSETEITANHPAKMLDDKLFARPDAGK
jgi:hypothetical protein